MNHEMRFISFLISGLSLFLIQGCDSGTINSIGNATDSSAIPSTYVDDDFFISEEMAITTVEHFVNRYEFEFLKLLRRIEVKSKEDTFKEVEHVLTLWDKNNNPALYLVNLEDQGFTVVPADSWLNPILAYSKTNKMPVTTDKPLPGGLEIWLDSNLAIIDSVRSKKHKDNSSDDMHEGWKLLLSVSKPDPDPDPPCEDEVYEVGPLMQTDWGQGDGYNNSLNFDNCSNTSNGRQLTGCTATAIAQVMRYHQYPSNYNWSSMPNGPIYSWSQPSGTNDIADLMYDVGDAVNTNWGCETSEAYGNDMEPALENVFNYPNTISYQNYNMWDVKDEINSFTNRPVIITGNSQDSNGQKVGHAWVADGYRMTYLYNSDCIASGYLKFHMNWGWNGSYNGWYSASSFKPGSYNFDSDLKQLIGIMP